ncbi:MAG: SRPBCC domain-containing protein [Planctomycetes bacterium]|nr:SRPBCC domain-containing protein [Planctomycetota bacterium]
MSNNKSKVEFPLDCEMLFTRVINAPRDLVWRAWTDPEIVVHWWGPKGFTNTIHEMDVRPGGIWRLTMHGPDGVNYPNRIEYLEVIKPECLVYIHGDDQNHHMFHVTTSFIAEGNTTKIISRLVFKTAQECEETKKFGIEGMNSTMERLREYLEKARS